MKKLLIVFLLGMIHGVSAQLFSFKNINHKNGLPLSSIIAINQDKFGYIWIGSDGAGMQRYDGKVIKQIYLEKGNNEHHVTDMQFCKDRILFSSQYLGYFQFKDKKLTQLDVPSNRNQEYIGIRMFDDGTFCFIGSNIIHLVKNGKLIDKHIFKEAGQKFVQILELPNAYIVFYNNQAYHITTSKITPLHEWLNENQNMRFSIGRMCDSHVELFDFQSRRKLTLSLSSKGAITSKKEEKTPEFANAIVKAFSKKKALIAVDNKGNLFHYSNAWFRPISKNFVKSNFTVENVFIDKNYDYWIATNNGVFKVSEEPFTKIDLSLEYRKELISFIYRNAKNDFIISCYDSVSYLGTFEKKTFHSLPVRIFSQATYQNAELFASSKGLFELKNGNLIYNKLLGDKKLIFIYSYKHLLFYCRPYEGLSFYNKLTKKHTKIDLPVGTSHVYTAQIHNNHEQIYFGTNNGIFCMSLDNFIAKPIHQYFDPKGSFTGVSCKDVHGTMWFALDKKLVGVTLRGDYVKIDDPRYFKSTIFYNLNADLYGNLIVGTNLGITKLKVDYLGNVLQCNHYDVNNGFGGYETHMRSSFQMGDYILIGTIEGMYAINTNRLEDLPEPPKPFVYQHKEKENQVFNSDEELIKVSFLALNPKLSGIQYSYRLKGKTSEWSDLTSKSEAYFSNLSDQEYVFQVKATYDGITFGPIANYKIIKNTPIWKSKWFILFLIMSIALANIIVLDRSKSFELSQIIENQNIEINSRIRSILLAFGFFSIVGSYTVVDMVDKQINQMPLVNITSYTLLFSLFLLSILRHPFPQVKKYLLPIALYTIIVQSYLGTYFSAIHPFYVIVVSLCTAVTPFILNKISSVVIFSLVQLISAVSIMFLVDHSQYNEILFLMAVIVSISLTLFTTYVRNDSLQKLIFISGIVNKGNILAIAFDANNKMTYISENSQNTLGIRPTELLGKSIQELHRFINHDLSKRPIKLEAEFKDNHTSLLPMRHPEAKELWMEWSCKVFSKKTKVIFGQDVTERVALETNYETLVENVDDLIYFVDVNAMFVFGNNKFNEVLGYEQSEIKGRDSMYMVHEDYRTQVRSFYEHQFQNRITTTYNEFIIKKKDGSDLWVGQNTTLLYAAGSTKIVKGFLSLARNITQKREQQLLIENQNEHITASIHYAKTIQENLLPSISKIGNCFSDFHIFYQAKDIISGDFYWIDKKGSQRLVVLADCTGHGVPGAFMTLLGINLLNQLSRKSVYENPGELLTKLDKHLDRVLQGQNNSKVRDGMEMVVLVYNEETKKVKYACAGGKFIIQTQDDFQICRGESKHIGDLAESNFEKYNTYELDQEVGAFYFLSDGIQDQFSATSNKKFTLKRLLENMKKNQDLTIHEQVEDVKNKFYTWKGAAEQTDDVTFFGFKFK